MLAVQNQLKMDNTKLDPKGIRVRRSPEFKLKDKVNRNFIIIKLKDFGFIPEVIIINKVFGQTNKFYVNAVLTDDEIKKENERRKKLDEQRKKIEEAKTKGGNQNGEQSIAQSSSK